MSVSIKFVCQMGELEMKAALLAASLSRFTQNNVELVAGLPENRPNSLTQDFLASLGVRLVPIDNPFGDDYPIANKISCLGIPTDREHSVFLDSDILCLRDIDFMGRFRGQFSAKLADCFTADLSDFALIQDHFGMPRETTGFHATFSGQEMPLYFNAGVVHCRDHRSFAAEWMRLAIEVDRLPLKIPRPWLDQLALPIVVARLGLEVSFLNEQLNYPLNLRLVTGEDTVLCHYHDFETLAQDRASAVLEDLWYDFPVLAEIAQANGLDVKGIPA